MTRAALMIFVTAACTNNNPVNIDAPRAIDAAPDVAIDAPDLRQGFVSVEMGADQNGPTSSVSAQFGTGSVFGAPSGSNGPCTLYQNPPTGASSAGVVTITGTTPMITLTPGGSPLHYTPSPAPPKSLYVAGSTITFQAAGADFPAFTATVTAPGAIAGYTRPTTLSRAGFAATWTAGTGTTMWLIIAAINGVKADLLLCTVDDTGSFTVPAAAFALLPAGDTTGAVLLARLNGQTLTMPHVMAYAVSDIVTGTIPITQ